MCPPRSAFSSGALLLEILYQMKDMKKEETKPKYIVFQADDTFSFLFWDDEGAAIGDFESFFIGDVEYSLSSLDGLKEWFYHADKYDPYTVISQFTTEGMEAWINKGYEYTKEIRAMLPPEIQLYYSFWHQFGDGNWRNCRAFITPF
jgi:hypothetical protein